MRFYHVEIARFAAAADSKWVDNLLSHFDIPGVESARQGLARRISMTGILHISLVRMLSRDIGVGLAGSVTLATRLLADGVDSVEVAPGLMLRLDREAFERQVEYAVAEAVESIAPARRGRPPKRPAVGD